MKQDREQAIKPVTQKYQQAIAELSNSPSHIDRWRIKLLSTAVRKLESKATKRRYRRKNSSYESDKIKQSN